MKPFKYNPNNHRGLYRHRITIQKLERVQDDLGQDTGEEWTDVAKAWAMIKTLQGREYYAAAQAQVEKKSRFIISYQPGITSDMRIIYNDRIFSIDEPPINDDEMNETLTMIVSEVTSGGGYQGSSQANQ